MNISNAPVGYQTQVRPAQVREMIRHCEALQAAFEELNRQLIQEYRHWWRAKARPQAEMTEWAVLPAVRAFREAALSNHFVCGNKWATLDELDTDQAHYLSRTDLSASCSFLPVRPDFLWLRRFIHSVVIWDVSTPVGDEPLLDVAKSETNWQTIAELLQRELDQAEHLSADPWADLRR